MTPKRNQFLLAGVAALLLTMTAAAPGAEATTLARLNLAQMARAADLVVRARCISAISRWDRGSIWTINDFEVLETFKGSPSPQLQVRLPGGKVGHLLMTVDAAPKFQPGAEAVLFLEKTAVGDYSVTAWAEGTFRIRRNGPAPQPTVTQDSSGIPIFNAATRKFSSQGIRNLPLDQFRDRLSAALAQASAAQSSAGAKP